MNNKSKKIISFNEIGTQIIRSYSSNGIIITPDNYYSVSNNGFSGVAFRSKDNVFPFEQFDLQLNRPDIVAKRLGYASENLVSVYYQAYKKRLKKAGLSESVIKSDYHLPEIKILSELPASITNNKWLKLRVKAWDSKNNLEKINVKINGVPVFGLGGIKTDKAQTIVKNLTIELSKGKNKVQLSVINDKGTESLKENFETYYSGDNEKPELYIIAIGVSEYSKSEYNLEYAAKDANDLIDFFNGQKESFKKIHMLKITDKDSTKENILTTKEFLTKSGVNDKVIFSLAGHGILDNNLNYYFGTTDIDFKNPSGRGLLYEEIEEILDGIPARNKLMLIDTCHSGEVDKEQIEIINDKTAFLKNIVVTRDFRGVKISQKSLSETGIDYKLLNGLFADTGSGTGTVVISSSSGVEFAFESDKFKNGVFTYSLLEALKTRTGDLNRDGTISVSELKDYVSENVASLTDNKQTPTFRKENSEVDFILF